MKKIISTLFLYAGPGLMLLLTCTHAPAQTKEPDRPVKTGNEWKMPADVFKRSQQFADSLTKALGLDAAASKKAYEAYLANTKPVDEIRMDGDSEEEKKAKMKVNHEAFKDGLKVFLTQKQFTEYLILYSSASMHKNSWILR